MAPLIVLPGLLFCVFSCIILSYISIATMVGPWIAPTIVLICHILFVFMKNSKEKTRYLIGIQAIGAGGGIIATGIGFAFPMLYFLEPNALASMLSNPWYFCIFFMVLCLSAGSLGLLFGSYLTKPLIDEQQQPFPVSNLTVQVATSDASPQQAKMLLGGVLGTGVLCVLRDGVFSLGAVIRKNYYLFPSVLGKEITLSIWPMLWAIGFTVGVSVTIPLIIGMVAKYVVVFPLAQHAVYLPFSFFQPMATENFAIPFCSGLVACELLLQLPKYAKKMLKQSKNTGKKDVIVRYIANIRVMLSGLLQQYSWATMSLIAATVVSSCGFLSFYGFSFGAQVLLLLFTMMATSIICTIGGTIGMIPFGRYSTFIVVPLVLLFGLSPIQSTIVCVFFNICAAAASDLLFDMKSADLVGISRKKMYQYQWIGLLGASLCMGIILWLLFTNLELGSEALFAQRSKAKALLLQSLNLDFSIVFLGILFGWVLKRFRVNSTMVFGGLVMPNSVTIGLALGSLATLVIKKPEKLQPLCAGALAAESLWIMGSIIFGK
jgi:hypothetical protein